MIKTAQNGEGYLGIAIYGLNCEQNCLVTLHVNVTCGVVTVYEDSYHSKRRRLTVARRHQKVSNVMWKVFTCSLLAPGSSKRGKLSQAPPSSLKSEASEARDDFLLEQWDALRT